MSEARDELLPAWVAFLSAQGQSPRTRRRYQSAVQSFVVWFETQNNEPFAPKRLTPIDLTGYRNHMQQHAAASGLYVSDSLNNRVLFYPGTC